MTSSTRIRSETDGLLDDTLAALSHPIRRHLLAEVADREPQQRTEIEPEAVVGTGGDSEELRIQLYHRHLPALDDAGFIEWDREAGRLAEGPRFDDIQPLIELLGEHREALPGSWP